MTIFIILGVVGVGYFVLATKTGAGSISATALMQLNALRTPAGQQAVIGSYPQFQPPAIANSTQMSMIGGAGLTAAGGLATAEVAANATAQTAGQAVPVIGAAVAILAALWSAHSARLKGAQNENAATPEATSVFDQAIQGIATAWNQNHNPQDTIQALNQLDQNIYTYLKSRVGAPGTAWSDAVGQNGQCDKSCTVGCCIYWGCFHGGAVNGVLAGTAGMIRAIQAGGNTIVPMTRVNPSKYSTYSRAAYNVVLT